MNDFIDNLKIHYIWVEAKTKNQERLLLKLFKNKISVTNVLYGNKGIQFRILESDYPKLKKIVGIKFHKIKESGIYYTIDKMIKKHLIVLGCILFCLFVFLFSNIVVNVKVIHSNKEVRELVSKALEEKGIKKLTFKKDFKEIEAIKKEVLSAYPEQLEWLEIEVEGMNYIVRIEERIITKPETKKERCHIVAEKSSLVRKLIFDTGVALVSVNDFVSAGDILISGEIMANEEIKSSVCASGTVFGEVWYTSKVSLPLNYEEKTETGKNRWNFMISNGAKDTYLLKPRLEHYQDEKKRLFSIFGFEIYFVRQKEVFVIDKTYTEDEAEEKALSLTEEKFKIQLRENSSIITKKVLKKAINDSTMDIEVFVSVLENIGRQEEFQELKEEGSQ